MNTDQSSVIVVVKGECPKCLLVVPVLINCCRQVSTLKSIARTMNRSMTILIRYAATRLLSNPIDIILNLSPP